MVTLLIVGILLLSKYLNWSSLMNYIGFLNEPLKNKILEVIKKVYNGLGLVFKTKNKVEILICTILIWLCYFLMTVWLIEACNIDINLINSFIVLIMGAIIISVPAFPGGLGTYEAGITYTLTLLFHIPKDIALSYAIVSHTSNYVPYIIIGALYFIKRGMKMSSLKNNSVSYE
tara:strand:- start:42 stop:563 length:522 start_codon:yes stop_codon:yes gene_type:complete